MQTHFSPFAWCVGLALLAVGGRAEADDCSKERKQRDGEMAAHHFAGARYAEALLLFQGLGQCSDEPTLKFNIARCHEELGAADEAAADRPHTDKAHKKKTIVDAGQHFEAARAGFAAYVESAGTAQDVPVVRERIGRLDEKLRRLEQRLEQFSAPEGPGVPPPPPPASPSPIPWVGAGVGLTAVGVASILGFIANGRYADAKDGKANNLTASEALAAEQSANDFATAANVLWIGGGAVALGGTIWGIVDVVGSQESTAAESPASQNGAMAHVLVVF